MSIMKTEVQTINDFYTKNICVFLSFIKPIKLFMFSAALFGMKMLLRYSHNVKPFMLSAVSAPLFGMYLHASSISEVSSILASYVFFQKKSLVSASGALYCNSRFGKNCQNGTVQCILSNVIYAHLQIRSA